jgi:adenylosuccinate synthase
MVDVILGLQWGDEGKGKIVDYFAPDYDIVARFQGGPNAGHTLYLNGQKVVLHQIPSGIFHESITNVIGSGVVLDPVTLSAECQAVSKLGIDFRKNLCISERTHLIIPTHRALDKASELSKGQDKIGSTLKGISPAYMDKTGRNGLRVGDLQSKDFDKLYRDLKEKHQRMLESYSFNEDISAWEDDFMKSVDFLRSIRIINGEYYINERLTSGSRVLAEGAQGSMLDVDFGTFPFVTSSNTISAGVCTGLGISPQKIRQVIGITKAYCTRVGSGPFPTELHDDQGDYLRKTGNEFGSTTGRPRRCGWIDLVALRYACMINGVTSLVMTKTDILDGLDSLMACIAYRVDNEETSRVPFQMMRSAIEPVYKSIPGWKKPISGMREAATMPVELHDYVKFLNEFLGAPIRYVSTGPGRDELAIL